MNLNEKKFHHVFVDREPLVTGNPVTMQEGISLAFLVLGEKIPQDRNALIDFEGDTLFILMRTKKEQDQNIQYPR